MRPYFQALCPVGTYGTCCAAFHTQADILEHREGQISSNEGTVSRLQKRVEELEAELAKRAAQIAKLQV